MPAGLLWVFVLAGVLVLWVDRLTGRWLEVLGVQSLHTEQADTVGSRSFQAVHKIYPHSEESSLGGGPVTRLLSRSGVPELEHGVRIGVRVACQNREAAPKSPLQSATDPFLLLQPNLESLAYRRKQALQGQLLIRLPEGERQQLLDWIKGTPMISLWGNP